jgi:hypothetical protein
VANGHFLHSRKSTEEGNAMDLGKLEEESLWFKYKTAVWSSDAAGQRRNDSPHALEVHQIMRTLRAVRYTGPFAYVSVPITSGKYFLDLQLEYPHKLPGHLIGEVIAHNYVAGWDLVKNLQKTRPYPILYPADLVPVGPMWEQAHFQALWLSIISEKCTEMHMSDGWEFSNGGTEEFTHAMQLKLGLPRSDDLCFHNTKESEATERQRMRDIVVYDHTGNALSITEGIQKVEAALVWIGANGFTAPKLENCLRLLRSTGTLLEQGFYQ